MKIASGMLLLGHLLEVPPSIPAERWSTSEAFGELCGALLTINIRQRTYDFIMVNTAEYLTKRPHFGFIRHRTCAPAPNFWEGLMGGFEETISEEAQRAQDG